MKTNREIQVGDIVTRTSGRTGNMEVLSVCDDGKGVIVKSADGPCKKSEWREELNELTRISSHGGSDL